MKKIILILCLCFAINTNAQFNVTIIGTGAAITNNSILTFNSVSDSAADLKFNINNTTASILNMKISCESITNATGVGMEFCFGGSCISGVSAGTSYPEGRVVSEIPAFGNNGNFDHFKNTNPGDGVSTQDYVFKFYQVDAGGTEVGTSITFTYRYQPVLATNSFCRLENLGIQMKSNIIENQLYINAINKLKLEIYDLNGRKVLNKPITAGENVIDLSNLISSLYILNFIDINGNRITAKCVKK
jgi:hypothetical protein